MVVVLVVVVLVVVMVVVVLRDTQRPSKVTIFHGVCLHLLCGGLPGNRSELDNDHRK